MKTRREFLLGFGQIMSAVVLVPLAQISARPKVDPFDGQVVVGSKGMFLDNARNDMTEIERQQWKRENYARLYGGTNTGRLTSNKPYWEEVPKGHFHVPAYNDWCWTTGFGDPRLQYNATTGGPVTFTTSGTAVDSSEIDIC